MLKQVPQNSNQVATQLGRGLMSSNTLLQRIVAIAICMVFLASCAGVPKRAMDGETRRLLVSVAIVEPSNPDQYMVWGPRMCRADSCCMRLVQLAGQCSAA